MSNIASPLSLWQLHLVFLRLGMTSFGGPMAHLAFFRTEFVERRKWLDDEEYADLVALCQVLPGPASSQVGLAIGFLRGGLAGALVAWLGFTLPSALLLTLFAAAVLKWNVAADAPWLHGLKIVSVAVVAQAIVGMRRTLAPDLPRLAIVGVATAIALFAPGKWSLFAPLIFGAIVGGLLPRRDEVSSSGTPGPVLPRTFSIASSQRPLAAASLILFLLLLIVLPAAATLTEMRSARLFAGYFQAGALVFGGGHVVLPMLQSLVVSPGWVSQTHFLAAYGAAQAVPGPLFTLASALGVFALANESPVQGALVATIAIFLPALLLVIGLLPFWNSVRQHAPLRRVLGGVNAAVLGLLVAAFVAPICADALIQVSDVAFAALAYIALVSLRMPPWGVVAFAVFLSILFR